MLSLLLAALTTSEGSNLPLSACIEEIAAKQGLLSSIGQPLAGVSLWRSPNVSTDDLSRLLPEVIDANWSRQDKHLSLVLNSEKWRTHRQSELDATTSAISSTLPEKVSPENRRQFFEDSLLPAEAMRLGAVMRAAIQETYQSPFSFWHTELLALQEPRNLAVATKAWQTLVFSTTPSGPERPIPAAVTARILDESRAFAEWISGWQNRVSNRQNLVALNLERFVEAAPVAEEIRHSLECRPGLIHSTVALYDRRGNLLHEDSRMLALPPVGEPKREVAIPLDWEPVKLSVKDRNALGTLSRARWTSAEAKELLSLFGSNDSPLWTWRNFIGESLASHYPDRRIIMWLPDSELFHLAHFVKGDQLQVAGYFQKRFTDTDGLSISVDDTSVVVRPHFMSAALDQVIQKESLIAFAVNAHRNERFSLDAELKLASAGDGYLLNPCVRTIRRLAAFIPFVWPYPPADDRTIWALARILQGGFDESRFPIQASAVPAEARQALYAMRSQAGLSIIAGQELAPKWSGAITSAWQNGIPGSAVIFLTSADVAVIRQRVGSMPWSSPSEPQSIGFTRIQLTGREFWPGTRKERHLRISDGRGAQIIFPIIDGFTFDEANQAVAWEALPSTHKPVILDPERDSIND